MCFLDLTKKIGRLRHKDPNDCDSNEEFRKCECAGLYVLLGVDGIIVVMQLERLCFGFFLPVYTTF